jgi:hypothetical protein
MRSQHIWTEKDAEGRKREVRAIKFGGQWRLQAKTPDDETWTYYEEPPIEDLLTLKDIIERKYRRRRASYEDFTTLEEMIRQRNADE